MSKNNRSLYMLIASMVIFGTIGIFRRLIPLPSASIAAASSVRSSFTRVRAVSSSSMAS